MEKQTWKQKVQNIWLSLSIKKRNWFFTGTVFFMIFLSVAFDIWVVDFSTTDFQAILEDNARNSALMDALESESNCFADYIKSPSDIKEEALKHACYVTKRTIANLPYDYKAMGAYRYGKTWAIQNSYEVYEKKRELILKMEEDNPYYIEELYKVYNMQKYLEGHAKTLMTYTLREGTWSYLQKVPYLRKVLAIVFIGGFILICGIVSLTHLLNKTIINPIIDLVDAAKKISVNNFNVGDVKVYNRDEMGELVIAFNKMKNETKQYIGALEEKREMANLLHKEELKKIEVERRLEASNLELLKNQINPHFLFNTLNVIGGMANLEDAEVTEKMIKALSDLFRYNLKTPEAEVAVAQELKVINDYMYLQMMRFGSRISYEISCRIDANTAYVPTFSFQPLVENAIIHGLAKKESGGKIFIRIWRQNYFVVITVADTGLGMTKSELEKLRERIAQGATAQTGIGLGNIYKRVHAMYPGAEIEIFSRKNIGTAIKLKIPQKKWEGYNVPSISSR